MGFFAHRTVNTGGGSRNEGTCLSYSQQISNTGTPPNIFLSLYRAETDQTTGNYIIYIICDTF